VRIGKGFDLTTEALRHGGKVFATEITESTESKGLNTILIRFTIAFLYPPRKSRLYD